MRIDVHGKVISLQQKENVGRYDLQKILDFLTNEEEAGEIPILERIIIVTNTEYIDEIYIHPNTNSITMGMKFHSMRSTEGFIRLDDISDKLYDFITKCYEEAIK